MYLSESNVSTWESNLVFDKLDKMGKEMKQRKNDIFPDVKAFCSWFDIKARQIVTASAFFKNINDSNKVL